MTVDGTIIELQLLATLGVNSHDSWTTVFRKATGKGEEPNYAIFLANEHCRLNGLAPDHTKS
jgi:hypothetical protein